MRRNTQPTINIQITPNNDQLSNYEKDTPSTSRIVIMIFILC